MRSEVVHADPRPDVSGDVRELLVLWQHPETREIVPIGRLAQSDEGYLFRYTNAAAEITGFHPLPGLGNVGTETRSGTLPAIFRLRVMDPIRADYATYLTTLGLEPATATPWEQIVHSGGDRAGDTLQFMEVPRVTAGVAQARFLVNGVRHVPERARVVDGREVRSSREAQEAALGALAPGDSLALLPEDSNEFDSSATLVSHSGVLLGWVPRVLAPSVRELLAVGPVGVTVVRVNGPQAPSHLRLVVDLATPAPADFVFDRSGRWEPISTSVGPELP